MARHEDKADWTDVEFRSVDIGIKPDVGFEHNGYLYATEGELIIAQMLDAQGIRFVPDVSIRFIHSGNRKRLAERGTVKDLLYVPDFIFFGGEAHIWTDPVTKKEELIHGLEAKAKKVRSGKARQLWEARQINVKVLNIRTIRRFLKDGSLPIRPFKDKKKKKK